jgi:DNA-binding Lrp family transcriptional regulator
MKLGDTQLDETDRRILAELQGDCKAPLAQVGKRVGLSAPSVMERIRKLEEAGIIRGYHAVLDSRGVGLDVTAFIGVSMSPGVMGDFEERLHAETIVVLSTGLERTAISLGVSVDDPPPVRRTQAAREKLSAE